MSKPIYQLRDELDYRENNPDRPVTGDVNPASYPEPEPEVGPVACIVDRITLMLGTLYREPDCADIGEAAQAGQEVLLLCKRLLLLEVTEPSRLDTPGDAARIAMHKTLAALPDGVTNQP